MSERAPHLADVLTIENSAGITVADVAVSISREPGLTEEGAPIQEARAGNVLPRLCQFAGKQACVAECQAPVDYANEKKDCATQSGSEFWTELGVAKEDVYLGVVTGSANVAFLDTEADKNAATRNPEGYHSFKATDAVFGYADTVKACRLADCGMVVVTGTDRNGRNIDGFIHATRNNMNGNDQFEDAQGNPIGGVTKMLLAVQEHYGSTDLHVRLAAGIAPELYKFDFTPSETDLQANPELTAEQKRERMFEGWAEQGWIVEAIDEAGKWDGKTYTVDMFAAIRDQVARAGLLERYSDEDVTINGELSTGHASNRAGKHGRVPEARDFYAVIPRDYEAVAR